MPWVEKRDTRNLPLAAAMFGFAVLAKGLVPLALAAPLLMGRHVRDWLRWRVALPFLAVALPWYVLCYWRNGWAFLYEFIVVQHFSRVTSDALMHQRPWWFYLPLRGGGAVAVVAAVRADGKARGMGGPAAALPGRLGAHRAGAVLDSD